MESPSFPVQRQLLNPKFEGYKLDPLSQEDCVSRYDLEYKPSQVASTGKTTFSFQEVQSRITHNHLAVCEDGSLAAYVDSSYRVLIIRVDSESLEPSLQVLAELPTPIKRDGRDGKNSEYPSVAFLSENLLFASDGLGTLYAVPVKEQGLAQPVGAFTIHEAPETPFRVHSAHKTSPIAGTILISCRHYGSPEQQESGDGSKSRKRTTLEFDVYGLEVELLSLRPSSDIRQLLPLWHWRGEDVPLFSRYHPATESYLLIGGSKFRPIGQPSASTYEPTPDEIAPIPRPGEALDSGSPEVTKPPPYSWTQTSDSVTVAIPLPSNTPKHAIKVLFSPATLTVHIDIEMETSFPIPRYTTKPLWAGIAASTSYWTWDKEAEHNVGLLTLFVDKQYEGTRWSHVFQSAGNKIDASSSDEDVEVPETLDPSELWHIRESLEKYTAALHSGEDASGLGLGRGVPSLAEGEMDMEVDESVGRLSYLTWVGAHGEPQSSSPDAPIQLLSTPLPGSGTTLSLIIKTNIDGAVFSLGKKSNSNTKILNWVHTSTFSALAFVLASKRDTRFTYHTSKVAFAFEGGVRDRGGNVYVYHSTSADKWGKQTILKVADGNGGSLLGVAVIKTSSDGRILVCLTEEELVLIKNL